MRSRRWGAALVFSATWGTPLQAAVLQLAPIPIEIQAPQSAAVLNLGNRSSADVALQTRVFRWTQEQGEDRLTPTTDVVVSPPITTVPAGKTLVVRVVRVSKQPAQSEETYRVLVDELPPEKRATKGQSLQILMRYSVPLFYTPAGAAAAEAPLAWRLQPAAGGALKLSATNPGSRRVRLSNLQLQDASGKALLAPGDQLSGYVLAGQAMQWTVKPAGTAAAPAKGTYRLEYQTEAKQYRENVVLGSGR